MRSQYALIGLSLGRPIYVSTLLFIDLDLQFGKFFPEPFLHRRHQPLILLVGIDQDHLDHRQTVRTRCRQIASPKPSANIHHVVNVVRRQHS
jgi:hypothetical protein